VLAQDVAQEAMLRALRYFHAFRGEDAKPWLLRIVPQYLARPSPVATRRRRSPLGEIEDRAGDGPDPEQSALAGDRRRQIAAALAALPAEAREVLVAARDRGPFVQAIAVVLDLPIGTVMSRLGAAREKLAARLRGTLERRGHGLPDM
jgi:RNA polymerase sigma-70 factor (ECF subfamily)